MDNIRSIVESNDYARDLEALGFEIRLLDEATEAITGVFARSPEVYPVIPGTEGVRVAKTLDHAYERMIVPALKVYFRIRNEDTIDLLAIVLDVSDDIDLG